MSLLIALPRESRPAERRVALDPSRVERLLQAGLQVRIEAECGHSASFHDEDYGEVTVAESFAETVKDADIVVKVVCPTLEEISQLTPGSILICIISAFQHLSEVAALCDRSITVLAMDHLPRTTRAQPFDALSSQATVAGYKAALLAAELSPRLYPMLTTAAGTIRPSRVLVIGAGVAGLQAIATSRRLGAQVEAYDIRKAAKEQIESLGARMIDTGVEVEGAGGLARPLRKDEKQKQHDVLAMHLAKAHVVICAASIPGRPAPLIISEDMVDGMLPESVIVDLAASTGGNCELTRVGEHFHYNDTLIVGPLNLPSHGAVHASEMYARNIHSMLKLIVSGDEAVLDQNDDIIARCVVCHDGQINHRPTADQLEREHLPFGGAVHEAADFADEIAGWLPEAEDTPAEAADSVAQAGVDKTGTLARSEIEQSEEPEPVSEFGDASDQADALARAAGDRRDQVQAESFHQPSESDIGSAEKITARTQARTPVLQDAEHVVSDTPAITDKPDAAVVEGQQSLSDADTDQTLVPDDLTLIQGIGPALQERLYAFGFRRWKQLAELDKDAFQKLVAQLELGDEVLEQEWPAQAQRLLEVGQ